MTFMEKYTHPDTLALIPYRSNTAVKTKINANKGLFTKHLE